MGVTYKAFDVDLRCPVTLKVISEKYLGDETARLRFVREARAAASVRHPNVASVFHLGRKGRDYFYAMEFVEGETLDSLIKRSGRLEVRIALEITKQVAAGLAAVHKKKLVHRDIKPSNIMVSIEEEGDVTAKIIDLGLAKVVDESGAQTTISASGAFAGTPEFASPKQIIGGEVDIRSDLYSLGVSLWQMLTGQVPFRGSAAGVMTTIPPTSTPKSPPGSSAIPVFTSISSPPLPPGSIWWNASLAKSQPRSSAREAFAASEPWSPTSSAFSIITIGIPNPTAGLQTPSASLKNSIAPGRPCSKKYTILFMGRHTSVSVADDSTRASPSRIPEPVP